MRSPSPTRSTSTSPTGGKKHIPMITLPGMRDRSILVNSMSKTFSVTGWRVGWVIASPHLTNTIRKVHDFLTVHSPTPLQFAGIKALELPDSYFNGLAGEYDVRRQIALSMLENAGLRCFVPEGAYYIMTDASDLGVTDDREFARFLMAKWAWRGCRVPASIPTMKGIPRSGSVSARSTRRCKSRVTSYRSYPICWYNRELEQFRRAGDGLSFLIQHSRMRESAKESLVRWSCRFCRWMAPNGDRLIPTLYKRGSKTGSKRPGGTLQRFKPV